MEYRFEVKITGTEHHTWQGVLFSPDGPVPFRSELELLLELNRRLDGPDAAWRGGACRRESALQESRKKVR